LFGIGYWFLVIGYWLTVSNTINPNNK